INNKADMFLSIHSDAATPTGVTTNSNLPLRVRSGPGTNYSEVGKLSGGTPVSIYSIEDGWYKIGAKRYVSGEYVKITSVAGGVTVFHSINRTADVGKNVADRLGRVVASAMGINFRGAKTRPSTERPGFDYYTVIDRAANHAGLEEDSTLYEVPYVFLIERGFHTNPKEEQLLLDDAVMRRTAKALADEIKSILID
ncbi:MAG: SH3 domain-containing protein, partial [Clostridia bacterium]|nr:SH3 domain-containing protein [Clostridia bacterium]